MTRVLLIAMVLLVPNTLGAADTTDGPVGPVVQQSNEQVCHIELQAPTKGKVGELIRFDLTKSVADSIKWITPSEDFESYEGGTRAVFSARNPGVYTFTIAAALGGTVDVVTHTIAIEGPPEKPESASLAEWIPYWLYSMQMDKTEALNLAKSFEDIASRIDTLSTPKGIIQATATANKAVLLGSLPKWMPLLKKIQASLANMSRAGLLKTPDQHKAVWNDIATGLRKYAE